MNRWEGRTEEGGNDEWRRGRKDRGWREGDSKGKQMR